MAHGNMSDICALALIAAAVQCVWFKDMMTQDLGPIKATFAKASPELDRLTSLAGGLLFCIGMTFSGVKWNPANGKMAGIGCFLAALWCTIYPQYVAGTLPTLTTVYAAVVFLGGVHIFAFPSNPLPPKTDKTKNNHGNMSDKVAMFLIGVSVLMIWYQDPLFNDVGPIKADFTSGSADVAAMIKMCGGLIFTIAMMFSGIKWNPVNGKMAGISLFITSVGTAYGTFNADGGALVPRLMYMYAAALFVGGLHVFAFPANPLTPKADAPKSDGKKA